MLLDVSFPAPLYFKLSIERVSALLKKALAPGELTLRHIENGFPVRKTSTPVRIADVARLAVDRARISTKKSNHQKGSPHEPL